MPKIKKSFYLLPRHRQVIKEMQTRFKYSYVYRVFEHLIRKGLKSQAIPLEIGEDRYGKDIYQVKLNKKYVDELVSFCEKNEISASSFMRVMIDREEDRLFRGLNAKNNK